MTRSEPDNGTTCGRQRRGFCAGPRKCQAASGPRIRRRANPATHRRRCPRSGCSFSSCSALPCCSATAATSTGRSTPMPRRRSRKRSTSCPPCAPSRPRPTTSRRNWFCPARPTPSTAPRFIRVPRATFPSASSTSARASRRVTCSSASRRPTPIASSTRRAPS